VQGYYIARPDLEPSRLQIEYPIVTETTHRISQDHDDSQIIYEQIQYHPPLRITDDMQMVFEAFRSNKDMTFFPVIDESGSPMGIVPSHCLQN